MELLTTIFELVCHQDPGRTLSIGGVALPACARCLGIYLGVALAALWIVTSRVRGRDAWLPRSWLAVLAAGFAACVIDGFVGVTDLASGGNGLRFMLGYLAGLGVGAALAMVLARSGSRPTPLPAASLAPIAWVWAAILVASAMGAAAFEDRYDVGSIIIATAFGFAAALGAVVCMGVVVGGVSYGAVRLIGRLARPAARAGRMS